MKKTKEKKLDFYPESVTLESTEIIVEQMKKCICKIYMSDGTKGTGFFCKIPFPDKKNLLTVLITNNHIINESQFKKGVQIMFSIYNDNEFIEMSLDNRIIYTNKEYDVTIIEIKQNKDNIHSFLPLDLNIIKKGSKKSYINESIYILQYPGGKKLAVSYGLLEEFQIDEDYNFQHTCCTDMGSSGSPILNIFNNKIIGIHKEADKSLNYNIGTFLGYPIKDFIDKKYYNKGNLKDKLYSELKDDISDIWNLSNKRIEDDDLAFLKDVNLKNIKELNLAKNNIINIKIFEKLKFGKLEKLSIGQNQIYNIDVLEKADFDTLKKINLNNNKISDIRVLQKVNWKHLEILSLSDNKISNNINVLANVKFSELRQLYLPCNNISDIKVLKDVKFEKLEQLYLGSNKISDISILEEVNFKELKQLILYDNQISNIEVLKRVKFEKLIKLDLSDNKILDINCLENIELKELEELNLCQNKVSDISILKNVKLGKIQKLDLRLNNIDINKYTSIIANLKPILKI